ncbi:5-dehydro-2-deoxygluconokinase [Halobacillus sp. Cin3]|uniref:5-dehydro-2-deoxygluconokinase n=1 Tax=Halobacillus sp. Cin3 TaxID=2928441 RepID=UPI00248F0C21|nr:5-dehydro-2-deoxygluconokinase [Halobacillus sp. Cin3]
MSVIDFDKQKDLDIIPIGRIGVDLNANEINRPMEEVESFKKTVGGSPANIAVGAARLGLNVGFISKVSNDGLGRYCTHALRKEGIDTSHVPTDETGAMNGVAFTEIISPSECHNILYRNEAADLKISPEEMDEEYVKRAKAILISGTALSQSPSREAVLRCITFARQHNTKVVFELDYRPYIWKSKEETAEVYQEVARQSHVIIGTRDEFHALSPAYMDADDVKIAEDWLREEPELVIIKRGEEGSKAYTREGKPAAGPVFSVSVVKTFGAGDAFAAGVLYGLINEFNLSTSLELGAGAAAIVISKNSCSEAMPYWNELMDFIEKQKTRKGGRMHDL